MAYMIQYEGNENLIFSNQTKRKIKTKRLLMPICIALAIIVFLIKPARNAILDLLFPGDSAVTFKAAENMIGDIQNGQTFKEAVTDFCVEIIENA